MKKLFAVLAIATLTILNAFAADKSKPNIVFLFADDLGIEADGHTELVKLEDEPVVVVGKIVVVPWRA